MQRRQFVARELTAKEQSEKLEFKRFEYLMKAATRAAEAGNLRYASYLGHEALKVACLRVGSCERSMSCSVCSGGKIEANGQNQKRLLSSLWSPYTAVYH